MPDKNSLSTDGVTGPSDGNARAARPASARSGEDITWGLVEAYSVDATRMMIKLNAGAIAHLLVAMRLDEPHFRTAASIVMLAFNEKKRITIRYVHPEPPKPGGLEVLQALEIGIGEEFDKALSFKDWPIQLPD
jgi:hypothetical protein